MARGFSIVFAIVLFTILATSARASPVNKEHVAVQSSEEKLVDESSLPVKSVTTEEESRKERQYGFPNYYGGDRGFANANAQASTNSFGNGGSSFGGNGDFASANAQAAAQASTNSFGNSFGSGGDFSNSNANAQASSAANSFGGGRDFSNANANANAQAATNSFGGYGK